jgi:hypothetical protein
MIRSIVTCCFALFVSLFLSGCYLTQAGALNTVSPEWTKRYESYARQSSDLQKAKIEMLRNMPRGGMQLTLDEEGRVKGISYTESVNWNAIEKIGAIAPPKQQEIKSVIEEIGDFAMKATNLVVPFASIYYGHKNHVATQEANVDMNASNNAADINMWSAFTGSMNNTATTMGSVATDLGVSANNAAVGLGTSTNNAAVDLGTSTNNATTDQNASNNEAITSILDYYTDRYDHTEVTDTRDYERIEYTEEVAD